MINYTLITSNRRSIGITVALDGSVTVRAPRFCSRRQVEAFLMEKEEWIKKAQAKMAIRRKANEEAENLQEPKFSSEEIKEIKNRAKAKLPLMVEREAEVMGVTYGNITIRAQKTRWGSCSSKGNLNFNCLLILLPENVQRYVVVHELCHRKEMNHSRAFWREVSKYDPDYKENKKILKELGSSLIKRV